MSKKKKNVHFSLVFQLFSIRWSFRIQSLTLLEIKVCSVIILNTIHVRLE